MARRNFFCALNFSDVLKGRSSYVKYWWWEKSSLLCFVIALPKDWVMIAVLIYIFPTTCLFCRKKWRLPFAPIWRIEHVLFVTTLNTNYRDTWREQWSTPGHLGSSQYMYIYYWLSCSVGFTPNTATLRWRCFQTNNSRRLLEDIERVVNNCRENSNLTSYSQPNHLDANLFSGQSLHNINQILIHFLRSKLISNSFSIKTKSFFPSKRPLSGALHRHFCKQGVV